MFILGLTGGIAAGKTTATDFFSNKGIQIVDADEISRKLQKNGEAGYVEILQRYGDGILGSDKEIDRKKLREKAFSKPDEKEWLESLMHPLIREATMNAFNDVKSDTLSYTMNILYSIINIKNYHYYNKICKLIHYYLFMVMVY